MCVCVSRVVGTRGQLGLPTAMLLYDKGAAVCVSYLLVFGKINVAAR